MRAINIPASGVNFGTTVTLLSGVALSAVPGFTPASPRIHVKSVTFTNPSSTVPTIFSLSKNGLQIAAGNVPADGTVVQPLDIILDSADVLTGTALSSGSLFLTIAADIGF